MLAVPELGLNSPRRVLISEETPKATSVWCWLPPLLPTYSCVSFPSAFLLASHVDPHVRHRALWTVMLLSDFRDKEGAGWLSMEMHFEFQTLVG